MSEVEDPVVKQFDLTDEEERALIALLRSTIDFARFPYAARYGPLKSILAKLEPPAPPPALLPAASERKI